MQQKDIAKKLAIITINVGHNDTEKKVENFVKRTKLNYPVIFDKDSTITKQYKVYGVPTVIIADTGGTIVLRQYSVPTEKKIKELLP